MKDHYKTLGLKKTATADEIRDRWIHLMWKLHPDRKRPVRDHDQKRVKEINEAYQILKDHSSRMEYDLLRTYGKKNGRFLIQKRILFGILIFFLAAGSIYVKNHWDSFLSGRSIPPVPSSISIDLPDQKGMSSALVEGGMTTRVNEEAPRREAMETPQGNTTTETSGRAIPAIAQVFRVASDPAKNAKRHDSSTHPQQRVNFEPSETPPSSVAIREPNVTVDEPGPPGVASDGVKMAVARSLVQQESPLTLPAPLRSTSKAEANEEGLAQGPTPAISSDPLQEQMLHVTKTGQTEPTSVPSMPVREKIPVSSLPAAPQIVLKEERPSAQLAPPRITGEEEVLSFVETYTQQYNRMNLAGFLSLFSSSAIQNRKHRFDEIKKMYANFFNESRELRYRMENAKIKIDREGVELKARYGIVQITRKKGETKVWRGILRWTLAREEGALKIVSLDYQQENPLPGHGETHPPLAGAK